MRSSPREKKIYSVNKYIHLNFLRHLLVIFKKNAKLEHCQICSSAEKMKIFQMLDLKIVQIAMDQSMQNALYNRITKNINAVLNFKTKWRNNKSQGARDR